MDNWTIIERDPTTLQGFTIRGYKCKHCGKPVLASVPDEKKWSTNILTYKYCPHCGLTGDDEKYTISFEHHTLIVTPKN